MLTKQKKISFLITTHNGEKYIITLLNKVIHLMEFDKNIHEIIILDDDSKDETISLIENYIIDKTDFIKLVKFNNKKGIFWNRVKLIEMSESTYIFFIDQDDDIKFDLIKRFNEIKQDYDIITVKRTQLIDKKYFEEKIYKINSSSLFTSYMLDKQFSTYITGIFINKSIYKKTNYYLKNINIDEIYVYEDMALYFLWFSIANNICTINSNYIYNRNNKESIINKKQILIEKNNSLKIFNIILQIYNNLDSYIKNRIDIKNFFFLLKINLLYYYFIKLNEFNEYKHFYSNLTKYITSNNDINIYIYNWENFARYIKMTNKIFKFIYLLRSKYKKRKL